jgi:type I restriction enzyme S subunit
VFAASGINGFHSEYRVKAPGVTTGRSGVLGRVFFCDRDFWPLNTSLYVKEYRRSNPWHAYYLLQTIGLEKFNAGSAVPTLNRNHLRGVPAVLASTQILTAFAEVCGLLFESSAQLKAESSKLAALRDYLLPRLLSGKVRVRDVEGTSTIDDGTGAA